MTRLERVAFAGSRLNDCDLYGASLTDVLFDGCDLREATFSGSKLTRVELRGCKLVGDGLSRDVDGAVSAGISAIWINRFHQPRPARRPGLVEIAILGEAPRVLGRRSVAG
jgi:uncharacterized protein YjbI with pentapeptide repeats